MARHHKWRTESVGLVVGASYPTQHYCINVTIHPLLVGNRCTRNRNLKGNCYHVRESVASVRQFEKTRVRGKATERQTQSFGRHAHRGKTRAYLALSLAFLSLLALSRMRCFRSSIVSALFRICADPTFGAFRARRE